MRWERGEQKAESRRQKAVNCRVQEAGFRVQGLQVEGNREQETGTGSRE
jgi:hypothetical protein